MDCIFCKIVAGEIPSHKVWEDENFLAFLDIHPASAGHTLVIPKKHFRWVWDLPTGRQELPNYCEYFEKVRKIALLLKEKLDAEWIQMSVMGIDISHAHVHLISHYSDKNLSLRSRTLMLRNKKREEGKENFEEILRKIKS